MSKKLPSQTYRTIDVDLDFLRNKLKLKSLQEKLKFDNKFPQIKEYLESKDIDLAKIRQHSAKLIGAGAIAGALLLSPVAAKILISSPPAKVASSVQLTPQDILLTDLSSILPERAAALTADQEKKISLIFKNVIGINAVANLEGEHLNTSYGLIGAEQHLRRYPGDTLSNHGDGSILNEGIAPGLGAWGYFAPSVAKLTPDLVEDEKWYVVVQTLYLPDWSQRLSYLRDWYKYRKVLVVNTLNGNAVVGDIADSGPAAWTGKSFGGSPEVMDSLGGSKYKVGPVLLFFVDDPGNKVPLGPVDYNSVAGNVAVNLIPAK